MTETLMSMPEQKTPESLIMGNELRATYKAAFTNMEPPTTYQMPQDMRYGDHIFSVQDVDSPLSPAELQNEFIAQSAREAYNDSWWVGMGNLQQYVADPIQAANPRLAAKHTLDIEYNGIPTGQQYEVFEVGEVEPDSATCQILFDTLNLIDQASGGALAADPRCPRVVLVNGMPFVHNPYGEGEALGFADDRMVLINTSGLHKIAERTGASFHELLAVTTVHEVLGHALERNVMHRAGQYFPEYFHYSSDQSPGQMFKSVHSSIQPKDDSHANSQPVREYGRVDAAEDLATSVDATVSEAMGWTGSTAKYDRTASTPDAYRRDLVMQLLDNAATAASKYDANPGIVGSEFSYITNDQGEVTSVKPAREMRVTTIDGARAMQQEIADQIQKHAARENLVIYNDDIM